MPNKLTFSTVYCQKSTHNHNILPQNNQEMEFFDNEIEWLIIYISFSDPDWYILDYINILTDF